MSLTDSRQLCSLVLGEFPDIVMDVQIIETNELRILLVDGSFIDVWYSLKLSNRYSYHWERRALDGTIYRHDNAPHLRWRDVPTFPRHFHDGDEFTVIESRLSETPKTALREFLTFARNRLSAPRAACTDRP